MPDPICRTQAEHWPREGWEMIEDIEAAGWSLARLERVWAYAETIATDALMIVQGGRVVASHGDLAHRFLCHSIRKSLLSALIGLHVEEGRIDLGRTLEELGIDDRLRLSARERQATVYDLLTARSGIYHPAGYETDWMRAIKGERHRYGPGTWWCYNNWDFNALGTIFTQMTGAGIHADFRDRIAGPLGLEDFRFDEGRRDGWMEADPNSDHPAYPFRMSTRDLARFGLAFLRDGRWQGTQVVPAHWASASVMPYSDAGTDGAYGYMWWVSRCGIHFPGVVVPEGTYSARGAGGHFLVVVPPLDLVVVHRVDTDVEGRRVSRFEFGRLLRLVLEACEAAACERRRLRAVAEQAA